MSDVTAIKNRSVFISYSHQDVDRRWIEAFARALSEQGVAVWFDEHAIAPGEPIRDAIEKGLRESDILVAILGGPGADAALYFEIGAAVAMGKRVVAVVPQDTDPSSLPEPLRLRRYLIQGSPEETARALVAA